MSKKFEFVSPTIANGQSPKPWKSYNSHIGPTERLTPLGKRIAGKTYCGLLSLAAGITAWCACRLRDRTDVSSLYHLYELIFAYQNDWRYFGEDALPYKDSVHSPMETSMVVGIEMSISDITSVVFFWKEGSVPDKGVFHMAQAVGYMLPARELKEYRKWLFATSDRLDAIAGRPLDYVPLEDECGDSKKWDSDVEASHGVPFSPQVLDVQKPFDMKDREELVKEFLTSLDWKSNPYLASPADMRKAGFEGEPYVG